MNNLISKCVKMVSGSKGGQMPVYKYQTKDGTKWYVKSDNLTKRGFNSRKEALQFEKEFELTQLRHLPTFNVIADDYLYTKKSSDVTYGTIDRITSIIIKHVLPLSENKPIDCYTLHDCRDFKVNLRKKNQDLSTTTLNYILRQYKAIFKHAVDFYGLEKNPCTALKPFKKTYEEKKQKKESENCVWSPEEFEKFISCVNNPTYSLFFTVLYYTGVRLGEAQALTWNDFDGEYIHITKSVTKKTNKGTYEIKEPKSESSIRKVSLGRSLSKYLMSYKASQEKIEGFKNDWFIFGGTKPLPCTSITRYKDRAVNESGVKRIRIHDFRHSHASYLICSGCNIVAVSKRLGHENVEITLETYTHLISKNEDEAILFVEKSSQNLLTHLKNPLSKALV